MNGSGENMAETGNQSRPVARSAKSGWIKGTTLSVVIALGLGGCSSLPDWANPVDWYDSAFNTDGAAPPQSERQVAANKSEKSFPSLNTVPTKAPETSSTSDRTNVASGLIADRDKAKYTDEDLRSGGKSGTQLAVKRPPAPKAVAKSQPVAPAPVKPAPVKMASAAPQPVAVAPTSSRLSRLPKLASSASPQPVAPVKAPLPPLVAPASATTKQAPMPKPVPMPVLTAAPTPVQPAPAIARTSPPAPLPPLVASAPTAAPTMAGQPQQGYVSQAVAPSFPNAGQNFLSQAFAASLAQSASTVTTAPASSTFNAPVAQPIQAGQSSLPNIVLAAYNDPLTGKTPASVTVNPGAAVAFAEPAAAKKLVVHFGNGSSKLGRKAKNELRSAAEAYKAQRRGVIRVVGHASHFTRNMNLARHRMINFRVSLDRANEVARELMRYGVDASALRVEAVSDADPVYYEHMPEGQAHNRRAEVFLEF